MVRPECYLGKRVAKGGERVPPKGPLLEKGGGCVDGAPGHPNDVITSPPSLDSPRPSPPYLMSGSLAQFPAQEAANRGEFQCDRVGCISEISPPPSPHRRDGHGAGGCAYSPTST